LQPFLKKNQAMKALKSFNINFVGLKEGKHRFEFHLDRKFLESFENPLLDDLNVDAVLVLDKHNNLLELHFSWAGTVAAVCDICNENYDMPIKGKESLIVKFVHKKPEDAFDPEVIYLQIGESSINVAVPLYEALVLQIPLRKVHPNDENAKPGCNPELLNYLEELRGDENAVDSKSEPEDKGSIWDELKKLK
jgi:uncharacterized metal-binding protein YceD (DUF177 family)